MENGWYYARNDKRIGPFSPQQLKDLASAGTILRTDTIWKGGVEKGVPADRVKHLFAAIIAPVLAPSFEEVEVPSLVPLVPFVNMEVEQARVLAEKAPPADAPKPKPVAVQPKQAPKGRASAMGGAVIVSQDGTRAKYRMVCKTCKHEDSSCQSLMITNKTFKRNFFCPKCRKRRDVTIQCQLR